MVAMPKSMAATGTTRSPTSSFDRVCRMKRAAPVVCVWFFISRSCRSLISPDPLLSCENASCRFAIAMSLLLAPCSLHRVLVFRSDPVLSGSATISAAGTGTDRQGLGGGGVKPGTRGEGGVACGSGGVSRSTASGGTGRDVPSGGGGCAAIGGEVGKSGKDGKEAG